MHIFDSYIVARKLIAGKPLVRLAKGLETDGNVVLKFYDKPELYAKALSYFKRLNKSHYLCKCVLQVCWMLEMPRRHVRPIEKIRAHEGFPDCLVFEKGIHTLDEWLCIPNISMTSKKDALQLVRVPSRRMRQRLFLSRWRRLSTISTAPASFTVTLSRPTWLTFRQTIHGNCWT